LAAITVSVLELPAMIVMGAAVRVTVGAGGGGPAAVTVTIALAVAGVVPAAPVAVTV
jgi:hypothetical protein